MYTSQRILFFLSLLSLPHLITLPTPCFSKMAYHLFQIYYQAFNLPSFSSSSIRVIFTLTLITCTYSCTHVRTPQSGDRSSEGCDGLGRFRRRTCSGGRSETGRQASHLPQEQVHTVQYSTLHHPLSLSLSFISPSFFLFFLSSPSLPSFSLFCSFLTHLAFPCFSSLILYPFLTLYPLLTLYPVLTRTPSLHVPQVQGPKPRGNDASPSPSTKVRTSTRTGCG